MLGRNNTSTCTCPANATVVIDGCELNLLVHNFRVGVIAKLYLYDVILDANVFSVVAYDVVLVGQRGCGVISRPGATIHEVLTDSRFSTS